MLMHSMPMAKEHNPTLLLLGAGMISLAPVFVKWIDEGATESAALGPTAMGMWRTAFGAITLFAAALWCRDRWNLNRELLGWTALAGLLFCADLYFWHRSVIWCGAGVGTILGNTQVFFTGFLSLALLRERLPSRFWVAAALGVVGILAISGIHNEPAEHHPRYAEGVVMGVLTGLAYASYLLTLQRAGRSRCQPSALVIMTLASTFTTVFLALVSLTESAVSIPHETSQWGKLIGLGVTAQALGWWAISTYLSRAPAWQVGLVLLLQPTLSVVWGMLFFQEQYTGTQWCGVAVTLTAIAYGRRR